MKTKAKTLSLFSLSAKFPDEAAAVKFFEAQRWGNKPVCPRCNGADSLPRPKRRGHFCRKCRRDFTVRTGTVFEESRLPLRKWLFAVYLIQTARKSVSALQLSKELDVAYATAWFLGHRIREACGPDDDLLTGRVEVDETYLGGKDANRHECKKLRPGGGTRGKTPVLGMREQGGRVRAMPVADASAATLTAAIAENVARGSVVITDEWRGYSRVARSYAHERVNHSAKEFVNAMAHTNGIESVWAVLKRGFNGTFHHWSVKHTHRYVNEFAFRLNEGNCQVDTVDRIGALIRGAEGKRLTYKALTA